MATAGKTNISLTTPDLVVLSYLSQKPRHGYELNAQLEEHDVKDWAGISRPQVYYSMHKLKKSKLIRAVSDEADPAGPERQVFAVTPAGIAALSKALDRGDWATQRPPPPFLTWMALSRHATGEAIQKIVHKRRQFLAAELLRERRTLQSFGEDSDSMIKITRLMLGITIKQFELELDWLDDVESVLLLGSATSGSQ